MTVAGVALHTFTGRVIKGTSTNLPSALSLTSVSTLSGPPTSATTVIPAQPAAQCPECCVRLQQPKLFQCVRVIRKDIYRAAAGNDYLSINPTAYY